MDLSDVNNFFAYFMHDFIINVQTGVYCGYRGPVQRIQSTACAHATVNPSWRQSLLFPCAPSRHDWPLTAVHVTVWDRDRFLPDRLIGYVTVKLSGNTCNSDIRSFICSFIHSLIHELLYSLIIKFLLLLLIIIHPYIHLLTDLFIHSFIHLFIHSLIHSFTHSLVDLFAHSFIHSFFPSFLLSFIHI